MYLIDANILFEIILKRYHFRAAIDFLKKTLDLNIDLAISSISIHGIEIFLVKGNKSKELKIFLKELELASNIRIYNTSITDELEAIEIMEKAKLDFEDTIQYYIAKKFDCKAIISYDKHFNKLDIPRKTPEEILKEFG